jgi:hypothetical protein
MTPCLKEARSGKNAQRLLFARRGKAARKTALTRGGDDGDGGGGDDGTQPRTPDLQTPSKAALLQAVSS